MRDGRPVRHRHPSGPGRPAPVTVRRLSEPGPRPADGRVPAPDPATKEVNATRPRLGHPGRLRHQTVTPTLGGTGPARVQGGPAPSGITAVRRVPPPGAPATGNVPPRGSTRSARPPVPASAIPAGCATRQ